jgi:hypothetical protein
MKKLRKKNKVNKAFFDKAHQQNFLSQRGRYPESEKNLLITLLNSALFFIFIFFLPTQLGKHFFPPFSYLNGIRIDYLSPTVYLTDIVVFLLFIFNFKLIIEFFKNKKVLFALGILMVNIFFATNQLLAVYRFIKIIEFLIVFYLGSQLLKIIREKVLLFILFFAGALQLGLAVFQMNFKHSLQGIFYLFGERLMNLSTPGIAKASINGVEFLRPYGTFSHPNSLAGFFLLLYFFVLTYKKFNEHFIFKYLCLFIFSSLIFISFSKTAILTFLILNTLYFILHTKIKCLPCKLARIFIPLILSLVFLMAITDPLTLDKRIELVKNTFWIIINRPIFGTGLNNYLLIQNTYPSKYFLFFNQPVHNIFLLFLAELGILLGGVLILLMYKQIYKFFIKNYFLVLVVLITGFFDHYWLTLEQNFLLMAFIYGSLSSAFFISKLSLRSSSSSG